MFGKSVLLSQGKVRRRVTYQFKNTPPAELTKEQIESFRELCSPKWYQAPATVTPVLKGQNGTSYPNYTLSDGTYWYITGFEPQSVANATGDLVFNIVSGVGSSVPQPCLDADCLITLADGTTKKFRDVTKSDVLKVFNHDLGCQDQAPILWLPPVMKTNCYWLITFESGKTIKSIKNHRFLCYDTGRYESTTDLFNKKVVCNDTIDVVQKIERIYDEVEYRNVISYYHMNFVADGFITSCGFNNIYPIKDMKFVKTQRTLRPIQEFHVPERWYDGMRLGEQYAEVGDIIPYVNRLIQTNDY